MPSVVSSAVTSDLKNETLQLLREYQASPSPELRNRLTHLNYGLVRREAHHWLNQCTESYEDLVQVGCIGLMRAIERFDMARGHAFSSFAIPYIRGEIQHYLRDKGSPMRIPRRWVALQRQAVWVAQALQQDLGRHPSDVEIAEALEISLTEWQEIKLANQNRALLSLDAPVRDEVEGTTSLGELIPDNRCRSFQLAQEDRIRLQQALAKVEARTRDVLEFVFLYDLTQKETAERLGVSSVTVSRHVKRGLEALKKIMKGADD